jgi:hypothetical protein
MSAPAPAPAPQPMVADSLASYGPSEFRPTAPPPDYVREPAPEPKKSKRLVLAAVGVVLALGAGALAVAKPWSKATTGSAQSGSLSILASASNSTQAAKTAVVTMDAVMKGAALKGITVNMHGDGAVDFEKGDMTLTFTMGGDPQIEGMSMEMRATKSTMYMRTSLPGNPGQWMSIDLSEAAALAGKQGSGLGGASSAQDPAELLRLLAAAGDGVTTVGTDTINDAPATHYHAVLDLAKYIDKVKAAMPSESAGVMKVFGKSSMPVDVWVDAKGRVVQEELSIDTKVGMSMDMTMQFSNFGDPVTVEIPANATATPLTP